MAIAKPPKLKNASDFMTKKKVKNSTPEEYYEVTSQKLGLYDLDTPYSGSPNARRAKEAEKRAKLPKINLQELRDNSGIEYREFLPREEVSRQNIIAHKGEQPKTPLVQRLLKDNATDETRATLGVQKKPSAPRINSQVATLAGKQPEQYSQQISAEGGRYLSDGDIKGQVADKAEKKTDIGAVGRSLRDLPRNLASGLVNTYDNLRKSGILGSPQQREILSEEDFNKSPLSKAHGSYENYLKAMNQYNEFAGEDKLGQKIEKLQQTLPSEVNDDTTLWEKMVRSAAGSWLPSMASAGMGGALAGVAGQFVSNPITLEVVRTMPLFASGMDSGLQSAEELGFEGAKKYSYAVISGLLEAGTERLSSLGLEGKLLGMKTSGGVGGTREFLRAIFEEAGSEALNEVGQQLLTGQYTNYEDFEMDMESVLIAAGSAALMGGFGATGELINGIKYRTVGTVDNKVIIETEDGRRESVSPEVVMKHQLNTNKEARKTQEILKADAEIQELSKTFTAKEETSTTMPVENATTPQERFEVETEPNTQIQEKAVTEPLNEQKQEVDIKEETKVIPPPQTKLEGLEERLDNMINKNLIDTKKKLDMAKRMNEQIVELGGKDRIEDIEPKKVEVAEDTEIMTSDDIESNDMAIQAEALPIEQATREEIDFIPEVEQMEGYKTSKTKESLLKTPNVPEAYKQNVITDDPMMYKESNRKARMFEANEAIDTKTYDVVVNEVLETHKADPKAYTAKEGQATIQALMNKNFELRKQFKDNGFYQEQYEKLQKVWRETGTEAGQALNMRKEFYGDSVEGKILEAERIVEESKTKQHKELEERMNDILDDIFNKTIELDENGRVKPDSDFEEVIAELKKEFGLTNAWIEMLRKSLDEGTLTKTKMKEIIKEKMGIPTLTMAEIDKITEIMEKLNGLDPESETYEKDKEAILKEATMVYAQKDVTFWTKLSTYQTMAMLMNVKTTLRNELGNLMGFTTSQVDDVYSFFFDTALSKFTNKRGTVNPMNPLKFKYKDGVKKSFEAYGSYLVDASDSKYVKRRVFAPGSKMGKLEGIMGVMLSDARWKQPRVQFLLDQIAATEQYAKARGLEYDAETARLKENINFIADYDTFNFDSKLGVWLDGVVKSTNEKILFGNKDFGLGTLFAKFAKTPMNIIQYQLDHIGADLLREGVKLTKKSKQIGFENALKQNQGRISRALGKTATGMTYITLGAVLSNLGAFVAEEDDKDVKNILEAQGIKGGYFNFSALRRSITSGKPSSYQDGDNVLSVNWLLPVAPFLLLGSRIANARDKKEAQDISDKLQVIIEAGGASMQDFAELPFNRTLGILTNSYDSGMDKMNKLAGSAVTGFVPSAVKHIAQGIDPTSKQYSKKSGEAVIQQIKATVPGLRNTVPNRFDVTGETQMMVDNGNMAANIFEMFLNPAYRDTIEMDKDLQKVMDLNKKVGLPSLPKITKNYFSYKSNRYDMTQEEHQEFQSDYWEAYKRAYTKKKNGDLINAHDYAMNQAKIKYLKKNKIKFETTSGGNLK